MNDTQIFAIQSIYYLAFCLLEIPTGLVADRFGHRRCLVLGSALLVVSSLIPVFLRSYEGFLLHFLSIALSRSLISGASSAYIYEYLRKHDGVAIYKQIEGNARAYGLVGKVICWAAVGKLMEWSFTSPYWLTAISAAISFGFALALPSFVETSKSPERSVRDVAAALKASPFLVFLMLQGVGIFVLARICQVNLFNPILISKGFTLPTFGVVMSGMTIFEAIGAAWPGMVRRYLSDLNAVYLFTLVMAVSLMLIPGGDQFVTLACLAVFSFATGISFPVQRQLMNDAITDSRYRATLLSVESILDRGVNAVVALFIGSYLANGQLNTFLLLSGGVTVAAVIVLIAGLGLLPKVAR